MPNFTILCGDAIEMLRTLPSESIDCCITSPPYWQLRDYGVEGQYGMESDWNDYLDTMTTVFNEVRRVLKPTGTLFINIGDKYSNPGIAKSSVQAKSLVGIPWRLAIRMVDDGWILRNVIVWYKPDRLPESVRDRFTCSWEPVFFFARSQKYAFNLDSVRIRQPTGPSLVPWNALDNSAKYRKAEDMGKRKSADRKYSPRSKEMPRLSTIHPMGKNPGDVWSISHHGEYQGYHEAKYPERLVLPMVLAGCPENGTVLDPFCGVGTTLVVALRLGRNAVGIDIVQKYCDITRKRCEEAVSSPNLFDQSSWWGPSSSPVDNSGLPVDNSGSPVDNSGPPVDNSGPEHRAGG